VFEGGIGIHVEDVKFKLVGSMERRKRGPRRGEKVFIWQLYFDDEGWLRQPRPEKW